MKQNTPLSLGSRHKRLLRGLLLLPLLGLVALGYTSCFGESGNEIQDLDNQGNTAVRGTSTWDVNDISILFPLKPFHRRTDPGSLLRLTEGRGLLTEAHFRRVLAIFKRDFQLDFSSGGQASLMNDFSKWAVVGFRIDHCFKLQIEHPCRPQVRLVAQAMADDDVSGTDFAMHLIYEPQISTLEMLKESIRIRETYAKPANRQLTLGKPLGVHPILKREGLHSDFAQAVKNELILKNISVSDLRGVAAAYIEPNRLQPWIFFATDIRDWDLPRKNSIFMFDPGTTVNDCNVQSARMICRKDLRSGRIVDSEEKTAANPTGRNISGFTPDGIPYMDDFLTLTRLDPNPRVFASAKPQEKMWEKVFNQIENPKLTAMETTNCVSCHRTLTDRVRFKGILDLDINGLAAFRPQPGTGCTPGNGIDFDEKGIKTINVRNFGYLHQDPIVSNRVVNETIDVCEHLKASLR